VVRSSALALSSPRPLVPGSSMSLFMTSSLIRARLWKCGPRRLQDRTTRGHNNRVQ
jgi:hypothetical protein